MAALVPGVATAHELSGRYESPLPLSAYLIGAATAVGLSFAFVLLRPSSPPPTAGPVRTVVLAGLARWGLRALGLLAWVWVVVQAVVGGQGEADAGTLFLWIYGWVGLSLVSAFVGPVWSWLDPFATLHDLGAAVGARLGLRRPAVVPYPAALGLWPAVAGYAVFVWLELVIIAARGGRMLGFALVVYTVWTLAMMVEYGRDTWRARGDTFSAWFALLGRLAPLGPPEPGSGRMAVRRFAAGLAEPGWRIDHLVLVAVATGGILYDGLSQTQPYFDLVGAPGAATGTLLLAGWLAIVAGATVLVGRYVGVAVLGPGLLPIAVGYLIAHYLTYILFDGQRVLLLLNDPLNAGSDFLGLGQFEPATAWLPAAAAWGIQLLAVVGGHMLGAWAGHRSAVREALRDEALGTEALPDGAREAGALGTGALGSSERGGPRDREGARSVRAARRRVREVPLALLMVGLTTLTLWSLGQVIVKSSG